MIAFQYFNEKYRSQSVPFFLGKASQDIALFTIVTPSCGSYLGGRIGKYIGGVMDDQLAAD